MSRAARSAPPPAWAVIMRMGLLGYVCAVAGPALSRSAAIGRIEIGLNVGRMEFSSLEPAYDLATSSVHCRRSAFGRYACGFGKGMSE